MTWSPASFLMTLALSASSVLAQTPIPSVPQPGATARPAVPRDRPTAPPAATGTAVLRGRVFAADGKPLRRAQITAFAAAETGIPQRHGTTTDADGKWEITDLSAGRYTVTAA